MRETISIFQIIQGLIDIIALIVFFLMAANVGKIKKQLIGMTDDKLLYKAMQKAEFMNDKPLLLKLSLEYCYFIIHDNMLSESERARILKKYFEKISTLGGEVPPMMMDFFDKHYK